MKFFITWTFFAFSLSSLAASNLANIRAEKQEKFEIELDKLIEERNLAGLTSFLDGNVMARCSFFEEMENVLMILLQEGDYEIASILLDSGVRINENLQEVLIKLIKEGEGNVLAKILEYQPVSVTVFCDFEELMRMAVETGNFNILDVLLHPENLVNHCSIQTIARIAKLALLRGQRDVLDHRLKKVEPLLKRMLLGSLLKISANREYFFIVQMCADANVSFKGLEHGDLWEIAKISAEIGCEKTTKALFKVFSIAAYIRRRLTQPDNPLEIARAKGNQSIVSLYENFM